MTQKINSKWYTYKDVIVSRETKRLGISNEITNLSILDNINWLILKVLDPLCDKLGFKVYCDSIYRTPVLNEKIGGKKGSDHTKGKAADLDPDGDPVKVRMTYKELFFFIKDKTQLPFDRLIAEPGWVHISYDREKEKQDRLIFVSQVNAMGKVIGYIPYEEGMTI